MYLLGCNFLLLFFNHGNVKKRTQKGEQSVEVYPSSSLTLGRLANLPML